MSYPKTRLTRPIRLAIMISLIVLFFIISPLVLLYTAGYRYDWRTGQVRETGVISIDITPADATVMLNGIVINKQMPIRLANRAPGRYTLTIQKPGYHTLTKDIEVESKQTTYIRDVPLFKDTLPEEIFDATIGESTYISLSYDGTLALEMSPSSTEKQIYTARIVDLITQETISQFTFSASTTPHGEWSPTSAYGMVRSFYDDIYTYHLFDANEQQAISSYTQKTTSTPMHQWQLNNTNAPLLLQDGELLLEGTVNGFSVQERIDHPVWYQDQEGSIWEFDTSLHILTQRNGKTITRSWKMDDVLVDILFAKNEFIIARTTRGVAILTPDKELLSLQQLPTEMLQFDPERNDWITWSSSEVWRISSDGKPDLLTRLGLPIQHVYPMDEFGTLLLDTTEKLLAFHPQFYSIQSLFDRSVVNMNGINQKERIIYFSGKIGSRYSLFGLSY